MSLFRATIASLTVTLIAPALPAQTPSTDGLPPGARLRLGSAGLNLGEGDAVVSAAALSPDGKYVAGGRGRITLFERATGKPVASVPTTTPAMALLFAPTGNVLAIGGMRSLTLVEVPSGKVLHELEINEENFNRPQGLAFSANGKIVSIGMVGPGSNKKAKAFAWEVATGKALGEFETAQNAGCSTALSPDGKVLATWGRHVARMIDEDEKPAQTVQLWDVATGKELRRIVIDRPNVHISAGAFAPDGKTLAVSSGAATFHLFDPHTGKEIRRFAGRRGTITTLQFSRDGRLLVAGSSDGAIQAWHTADGKRLALAPGPRSRLLAITCPDGEHVLALAAAGQSLLWWDALTGEGSQTSIGHQLAVVGVAFTPDGKLLRSLSLDGKVLTWEAATGKRVQQMSVIDAELQRSGGNPVMRSDSLALSPDARFAATKSIYNTFRLWDLASGEVACDFEPGKRPTMTGLVFSADGSRLAAALMNEIHIWDTDAGHEAAKVPYNLPNTGMANGAPRLAYAPDGKRLALVANAFDPNDGTASAHIALLDVATGKELRAADVPLPGNVNPRAPATANVAFSPDSRFIALPGVDGNVIVVRAESGKEYRRLALSGITGTIAAIAFSPDGRTVAVAHGGEQAMGPMGELLPPSAGRIEVFERASGKLRAEFTAHLGGVNCLAFAPDGLTLATGGADTTVILWDLAGTQAEKLTGKAIAAEWPKLAQPDARVAFGAMRRLIASPAETVDFLKQQLRPAKVAAIEEKQIAEWVANLDSENFDKRDSAYRSLEKIGAIAEAALSKARQGNASLEMRRRIDDLLDKIERGNLTVEDLQATRAVEVLERIGTPAARQLLATLAGGAPSAILSREARQALARLKR